jgi:hypothetical protein
MQRAKGKEWELICDVCKSNMVIGPAANPSPRMPSGWFNHGRDKHTCAACSLPAVHRSW